MMHQQPQESIWGTINSCAEIALNIYMIIAVDENGREHSGIMAHQDTKGKVLSEKAADLAEKDGEWLCFDENHQDVAMYEVLQKRLEACKKMETAILTELEEMKQGNQILLPQYFGECTPPAVGTDDIAEPIRNGIYQINRDGEVSLAVHDSIVNHYLTPLAMAFARSDSEYHYFSLDHAAVPVYELKPVFAEVENLIISNDSLYATLHGQFPEYVSQFNKLVPEGEQIPEAEAPLQLFLPVQLEQGERDSDEPEPEEQEEYGETVDYGIEP